MYILGFNCFSNDSSAALIKDGILIYAVEEERLTRKKHTSEFPINSIRECLKYANISIDDVDHIVYYWKPFHKITNRIIAVTYSKFISLFKKQRLNTIKNKFINKVKIEKIFYNYLKSTKKLNFHFVEHHLTHASSTYMISPFKEAAILTIDGVGEWTTSLFAKGENNKITKLQEIYFPNSLGEIYGAVTEYLGFKKKIGEGKVMGLAPYGTLKFYEKFKKIIKLKQKGKFIIDGSYFGYPYFQDELISKKFIEIFGPKRIYGTQILQRHKDIAKALQRTIEETAIHMANYLYKITNSKNLCLAGGTALNSVMNARLLKETKFEKMFIQPGAGDNGCSIGAAFYFYNHVLNKKRNFQLINAYLGNEFNKKQIKQCIDKNNLKYKYHKNIEKITANLLSKNKIIGWFQGRMEFGPRALGNRSILANPKNPKMKDILNSKVKHRESFRPFAPSVLEEESKNYFNLKRKAPYMLLVTDVKKDKQKQIPSVIHIDKTARLQTVSKEQNPKYHKLIKEFKKITNIPLILNTSFNVKGEPIVHTPQDAINCFNSTKMDYLVLENFLIKK